MTLTRGNNNNEIFIKMMLKFDRKVRFLNFSFLKLGNSFKRPFKNLILIKMLFFFIYFLIKITHSFKRQCKYIK